jgi:hypothetical protein
VLSMSYYEMVCDHLWLLNRNFRRMLELSSGTLSEMRHSRKLLVRVAASVGIEESEVEEEEGGKESDDSEESEESGESGKEDRDETRDESGDGKEDEDGEGEEDKGQAGSGSAAA